MNQPEEHVCHPGCPGAQRRPSLSMSDGGGVSLSMLDSPVAPLFNWSLTDNLIEERRANAKTDTGQPDA